VQLYVEVDQLLDGARLDHLQVELTGPQQARLTRLAAANGWAAPEAILIVLAQGWAFLQALTLATNVSEPRATHSAAVHGAPETALAQAWEHAAITADGRYAAAKFLVFRLTENNQTLIHNRAGLLAGMRMAEQTTAFLVGKRARLEQESARPRDGVAGSTGQTATLENGRRRPGGGISPAGAPAPDYHPPAVLRQEPAGAADPHARAPARDTDALSGGGAHYDLDIIDRFTRTLGELSSSSLGCGVKDRLDRLIEAGLTLLELQAASATGDLPCAALDLIERGMAEGGAGDKGSAGGPLASGQALKALNHYIDVHGKTLVMETRLATLNREGKQLEQEVHALRDAHERWRDWAWAMREYLARLEQEHAVLRAKSERPLEGSSQAESFWQRLQRWLFGLDSAAGIVADLPSPHDGSGRPGPRCT
jgi:hypothetical protein